MKATFTLPVGTNPIKCAAKPSDRRMESMTGAQVDTKAKRIVATDGRCLVSIPVDFGPCDPEEHGTAIVTSEAIAESLKMANGRHAQPATIDVQGECVSVMTNLGMRNGHRVIDGQFPRVDAVIPASKTKLTIGLDVRLLAKIADALGVDGVRIEIPIQSIEGPASRERVAGAMMIRPISLRGESIPSPDAFGVLMPVIAE